MKDDLLSAERIYQAFLDATGAAVESGNFDLYADHFTYPNAFETSERKALLRDREDLRGFFEALRAQLERRDVQAMDRVCKRALFTDVGEIKGYHQTRIVRRDAYAVDGYEALCTLVRKQGRWLLAHSQFTHSEEALPAKVLQRFNSRRPVH